MRRAISCLGAGVVLLGVCDSAHANEKKYIDDNDIATMTELLSGDSVNGIPEGIRKGAKDLVSDLGKALLASFLNSYVPGAGSLLGGGNDGLAALQAVMIERMNLMSGQVGQRFDAIDGALRSLNSVDILTDYNAGMAAMSNYRAAPNLAAKFAARGQLEEAMNRFSSTTSRIEAYTNEFTHEASLLFWQLHATALALQVGLIEEFQMLVAVQAQAGNVSDLNTWLVNLNDAERAALDQSMLSQYRAAIGTVANRVFAFYNTMGTSFPGTQNQWGQANGLNRVEKVVDSWFTVTPQITKCWDPGRDVNWRVEYKNLQSYSINCLCEPGGWIAGQRGNVCTFPLPILQWYYNVHAPNASCLDKKRTTDLAYCNRYFFTDYGVRGSDGWKSIYGTFDGETQWFNTLEEIPNVHYRRVYAAYLARVYAPVIPFLDSLWLMMGNTGPRPRNGLDNELDFIVEPATIVPEDVQVTINALRATINFNKVPGHSTALALTAMTSS